jgi:predicted PurR-regulated permease PerM
MMGLTALPLWRPLLLAMVLAAALTGTHEKLAHAVGGRRWLSSGLMTLALNILILLPITTLVIMAISQADDVVHSIRLFIEKAEYEKLVERLPEDLQERAYPLIEGLPGRFAAWADKGLSVSVARQAMGGLTIMGSILTQFVLMIVAFYFLLVDGHKLRAWVMSVVPLRPARVRAIVQRFRRTARTVLGANLLTAIAQGAIATVGYLIGGVPQALFSAF